MEAAIRCSKCGVQMEEGFIADQTYGGTVPSTWIEGEPERSFWTGLKTKGKEAFAVRTYRCAKCGRLESYAI